MREANAGYAQELATLRQQLTDGVITRSPRRKGEPVAVPACKRARPVRRVGGTKKPT